MQGLGLGVPPLEDESYYSYWRWRDSEERYDTALEAVAAPGSHSGWLCRCRAEEVLWTAQVSHAVARLCTRLASSIVMGVAAATGTSAKDRWACAQVLQLLRVRDDWLAGRAAWDQMHAARREVRWLAESAPRAFWALDLAGTALSTTEPLALCRELLEYGGPPDENLALWFEGAVRAEVTSDD